jgi:hypothetical protein
VSILMILWLKNHYLVNLGSDDGSEWERTGMKDI